MALYWDNVTDAGEYDGGVGWAWDRLVELAYGSVMLAGILQGVGAPVPGGVILALAGVGSFSLPGAATAALRFSAGYLAGACLQYLLARLLGRRLGFSLLPGPFQRRVRLLLQRFGPAAVLWGRPFWVGNYMSAVAAALPMHPVRFVFYTVGGILPWALCMSLAGSALQRWGDLLAQWWWRLQL